MRRFPSILILLVCLALRPAPPAEAGLFDAFFPGDTLVTIDGTVYTGEDFKRWWQFWQEPDQPLPKTPEDYIDWLLLAREGKRMQLDEDPAFKRGTRVFLQSRTLLMLKYEAVDSQIKIADAEVRERYDEKFSPRWLVQKLEFGDEAGARAAWEGLSQGTLAIDELLARESGQGGPVNKGESWLRPNGIDPGWASIFSKHAAGEVVDPSDHKGGASLYYLKEQKGWDEEDFAALSEEIRREIRREKEHALTLALLEELRRKYRVEVDEERIEALDINAPDDSFSDAVVISSTQQNVTEREFMAVVRKLMANRSAAGHAAADPDMARKLKNDTVDNIIAQSVTNWESLDRHFEEREPFKWEYQFNFDHRLVLALEQRLFLLPENRASEEEIKGHYQENLPRYTQPSLVHLNIVEETYGPIEKVWADVMAGKEFRKAVKDILDVTVETREVPANHLDPEVKAVVDKLAVGETSPIFNAQGIRVIVHLENKTPAVPLPLERVKETIRSELEKKKIEQAQRAYVETIKARSNIEVRERRWKAIQKELGGA